jgi:hypothetical protein
MKIVVFDLDETLGYFVEFGIFWDSLSLYLNKELTHQDFNGLMDLYPEFLRPNILGILNYLKKKKEINHCDKLMIYTNNQGPKEWAKYIKNYFETKLDFKIFDQIIAAFKVQGQQIELCRTTHMKTHKDLIKCTKIPEDTYICFLDDVFYPGMSNDKIYYINIKPYIYDLTFDEMINRFQKSGILKAEPTSCREQILTDMNKYTYIYVDKSVESQNIDKILSKQIIKHLHIFFDNIKIDNKDAKHNNIGNKPKKITDNKPNKFTKNKKVFRNRTLKKKYN